MSFEVIPGGLFVEDIPCPDKPASEWTAEEAAAYRNYLWDHAEEGCIELTVKRIQLPLSDIRSAISVLEAIRDAFAADAEKAGYRDTWNNEQPESILNLLKLKEHAERSVTS